MKLPESKPVSSQFKTFTAENVTVNFNGRVSQFGIVSAVVRWDDICGNGHNTFSITGSCKGLSGCIHDIIEQAFPVFAHLIKYHLCTAEGQISMVNNTLYHSRSCDHAGKKPGDPVKFRRVVLLGNSSWPLVFKDSFVDWLETAQKSGWILTKKAIEHKADSYPYKPNYTIDGYDCEWYACPFDNEYQVDGFIKTVNDHGFTIKSVPVEFAKAVEPDIEAARRCACWPEATLEQLQDPEAIKSHWEEEAPKFKAAVESLGFEY